ncbi:MAG: aminopeptidase P family protein [Gemmatimonadetes bacterium]|nr:aminopeptidase P family protein [Gemmatimonadota bacterium]
MRAARRAGLGALIAERGVDAMLVSALPNIRYLTGFSGSNALLLVTADGATLLTDFRYATQVKTEVDPLVEVLIAPASLWTELWRILGARPAIGRIAFETARLLHQEAQRFLATGAKGARWHWEPVVDLVEGLREAKDAGEVAEIRAAIAIAEQALNATLPKVRVGMTELAVAGELERALRAAGSEGFPFETIVASGPRSALPHARASTRVIERGELLLIDFGAIHHGYCADITRTFVVGTSPSDRQREIHALVRESNGSASALVRQGMRGRDADASARDYIERAGFGEAFGHSLGHGIGLEVHEAPRLAKTAEAPLPLGAVVTIEPGVYLEGWGGVRIEDDVLLGPEGPVVLTSFPRDLVQL